MSWANLPSSLLLKYELSLKYTRLMTSIFSLVLFFVDPNFLEQCFSHISLLRCLLGSLLRYSFLGPTSKDADSVGLGRVWDAVFLRDFHWILVLPVQGSFKFFTIKFDDNCRYFLRFLCVCACMCVLSHIWLFATPWTVAHKAPLSMEFSRQEYWSGFLFLTPAVFPYPGIKSMSSALAGRIFIAEPPEKPFFLD